MSPSHRPRQGLSRLAACALFAAWMSGAPAGASGPDLSGPLVNPVGPIELDRSAPGDIEAGETSIAAGGTGDETSALPPPTEQTWATPEVESDAGAAEQVAAAEPAPVTKDAADELGAGPEPRALPKQEFAPLGAPASSGSGGSPNAVGASAPGKSGWMKQTGGALGVVLALILLGRFGLVALARRAGGLSAMLGAGGRAPSGVMEILARYPVSRGHTLVLLKVDRRVLVLCHTSSGFTTLTEFIEPEEVASILMRVRDEEGESMAARFSEMLNELSDFPPEEGGPVSPRIAIARDAVADRGGWPTLRAAGGGGGGAS